MDVNHLAKTAKTAPNERLAELDMHPRPFGSRLRINLSVDPLESFFPQAKLSPLCQGPEPRLKFKIQTLLFLAHGVDPKNPCLAWLLRDRRFFFRFRVRHERVHRVAS